MACRKMVKYWIRTTVHQLVALTTFSEHIDSMYTSRYQMTNPITKALSVSPFFAF